MPAVDTVPDLPVILRDVAEADHAIVEQVLALNEAEVRKLAPMDRARFAEIHQVAAGFEVIEVAGRFGGFVVTVTPGSDYDGVHYAWFSERYKDFLYLDRIVLAVDVRRQGVGGRVYDELERRAAPRGLLTLEVNLEPPNPASLAFHRSRGYIEVGRAGDGAYRQSLMVKDLSGP